MTTDNPIIAKILKLLALANPEAGATPAEAKAAMTAATRLMTQHQIDATIIQDAQVAAATKNGSGSAFHINHTTYVCPRRRKYDYDENVAMILKQCFGVKIIWSGTRQAYNPTTKAWQNNYVAGYKCDWHHTYIIIGDELEMRVAQLAIPILLKAMSAGIARHLKERGLEKWTATVGRSFYDGLTYGYVEGSEQGRANAYREANKAKTDAYALVLVDKKDAIVKYIGDQWPELTESKSRGKQYEYDYQAFRAGERDGKMLDVSRDKLASTL